MLLVVTIMLAGIIWSIVHRGFVKTLFSLVIGVPSGAIAGRALGWILAVLLSASCSGPGCFVIFIIWQWMIILGAMSGFFVMVRVTEKTQIQQKNKRDIKEFDLQLSMINEKNFAEANFRGLKLPCADFRDTNLWCADFQDADLQYADFTDADMSYTNLQGANMVDADFQGANLRNSILPDGTKWQNSTDMERFTDSEHYNFWRPAGKQDETKA